MTNSRSTRTLAAAGLIAAAMAFGGGALAQNVYIYPNEGQSQDQQDLDTVQCQRSAQEQTGFDPTNPQASATQYQANPDAGQGAVVGGSAKGAAGGAAIGAIAGDAGKGAAIGATAGAFRGASNRRKAKEQEKMAAEQATQQSIAIAQDNYNRALGACMEARGYSVK